MRQPIGEIVCQLRRLRKLTQRELAGDRYSKSYVSAIEQSRIAPSAEALHYFAQRLGQADGNFVALLEQPEVEQALAVLQTPLPGTNGYSKQDGALALLPTLLEQAAFPGFSHPKSLPALAPGMLASLPPPQQAHYFLLLGRGARARGDVPSALHALETALAIASADQLAAILDELGLCYAQLRDYHTAFGYHLHALGLLSKASSEGRAALQVALELHCGDAYRAVGAYPQALAHYEAAHTSLSAHHDLATAGQVYARLGSLLYASFFPATAPSATSALSHAHAPEQIERAFERASSFLQQGVGFYRAGGDRPGEAHTRLALASLYLDWAAWRQRRTLPNRTDTRGKKSAQALATTLLDDAAEHCRQVLLAWQEPVLDDAAPPPEVDTLLYTALAALIRSAVQRATRARLRDDGSVDIAYRERAFAAHLCRLVLDTLSTPDPPWSAASHALTLSAAGLEYRSPTLPRFTDLPELLTTQGGIPPHRLPGLTEVYAAVGEVAEELGRVAAAPAYAHDWYAQANQYQQAALSLASRLHLSGERDPGYLARLYQRWITLLQERAIATPDLSEETTRALLRVLQQEVWHLQPPSPEEMSACGRELSC